MRYLRLRLWKKQFPSNGFTLVELSVVLALCMLVGTLAMINFSWLDRVAVRTELDTLYATCHYLQQRARATNTPQELLFNPGTNSYSYSTAQFSLPHTVQFGVLPGIMGPPATPTHAITQPITFVGNKILFYPEGIIQAGAIYLKDTKNRVQYALSSGVSTVSYLRKYQYTGGEWKLLS